MAMEKSATERTHDWALLLPLALPPDLPPVIFDRFEMGIEKGDEDCKFGV
jgi:hypothetical protein